MDPQQNSIGRALMAHPTVWSSETPPRAAANQIGKATEQAMDSLQQTASRVLDQARKEVTSQVSHQKEQVVGSLDSVAHTFQQVGQQLQREEQRSAAGYLDQAANQVEQVSRYVRRRRIKKIVTVVEQLARRQPAVFFGGVLTLGIFAAYSLKSSIFNKWRGSGPSMTATGPTPYPRPVTTSSIEGDYGANATRDGTRPFEDSL